jgi:hypothetical protein
METKKRKFSWMGLTLRKEHEQSRKLALQWNPQGKRGRERPRNSWKSFTLTEAGRS